jgi:hypothetical protein
VRHFDTIFDPRPAGLGVQRRCYCDTIPKEETPWYLKQGWEVAARTECEPPGHTRFYMTKKLS